MGADGYRARLRALPPWSGVAAALVALVALVLADLELDEAVFAGTFVLAPFLAALTAGAQATAAVSLLALLMAALTGLWNDAAANEGYEVKLVVVALGGTLAVVGAAARRRAALAMRRLQLLNEVGGVADGSLALGQTIERLSAMIVPELADVCMIDALREGEVVREAVRAAGGDRESTESWLRSRRSSVPGEVFDPSADGPRLRLLKRMPDSVLRDLAHDPGDLERLRALAPRSAAMVQMASRGRVIGALTLVRLRGRAPFREDDAPFLGALAGRIALALDSAGLFSDVESVERRMDVVMSTLAEAVVIHDSQGRLVYANEAAARLLGLEGPEEVLERGAAYGRERFDVRRPDGSTVPVDDTTSRRVLRGHRPGPQLLRITDRETGEEGWRVTKSSPIAGPDGTVLYAVTAIEDVTDVKRAELAQRLLAQVGEALASSIDPRESLERAAWMLVPDLGDCCVIERLREGEQAALWAFAHADPEMHLDEDALAPELVDAIPDAVASGAVGELRPDALGEALRRHGIERVAIAPLRTPMRTLGTITVGRRSRRPPFAAAEEALVGEIGERAGIAAENAMLAQELARTAAALQRELLPPNLPQVPGWSLASLYRPAGEAARVGGDFYDGFDTPAGLMLLIGDVAGRGAEAASLTAVARYTIRTAAQLTGDPITAMAILNESLRARPETALCTAMLVLLGSGEEPAVELVSAGHPLPLRVGAGEPVEVGESGAVLGAFEDAAWPRAAVRLSPGEGLVLYTDGVTDAQGAGERFGSERLVAGLRAARTPAEIVARIESDLEAFVAGRTRDDAALVALMSTGASAVAGSGGPAVSGRVPEGTP